MHETFLERHTLLSIWLNHCYYNCFKVRLKTLLTALSCDMAGPDNFSKNSAKKCCEGVFTILSPSQNIGRNLVVLCYEKFCICKLIQFKAQNICD